MRAILVSVNYTDILKLTLGYNRHHFSSVLIVTSLDDYNNVLPVAESWGADVLGTDVFYDAGAHFNKYKALELGLDTMGRHGWICIMDADIFWPKTILGSSTNPDNDPTWLERGKLYGPLRHMCPTIPQEVPPEPTWGRYPLHGNQGEWAGYSQIFHAEDTALGQPPWHEVNWKHAGGGDSFLQMKWKPSNKVRPHFKVLHIGPAGSNWCGRTTRLADGSLPPNHDQHKRAFGELCTSRRMRRGYNNPVEKLM